MEFLHKKIISVLWSFRRTISPQDSTKAMEVNNQQRDKESTEPAREDKNQHAV